MKLKTLVATLTLAGLPHLASAAATYCSDVGNPNSSGLYLNDVTINTHQADDCYGTEAGNPDGAGPNGNDQVGDINALDWGTGWQFAARDNTDSADDVSNTVLGYTWSVGDEANATSGDWSLTLTPGTGLPKYFDLVITLKGGPGWGAWLFDDEKLNQSNDGTYVMHILNKGQRIAGLSHLSVYVREGTDPCTLRDCGPNEIPAPGTLGLLGAALFGWGARRLRK